MGFLNDLRSKSLDKVQRHSKNKKAEADRKKPASALHILFKKCRKMQNDCPKAVV